MSSMSMKALHELRHKGIKWQREGDYVQKDAISFKGLAFFS